MQLTLNRKPNVAEVAVSGLFDVARQLGVVSTIQESTSC